jgi:shikimate kinase
MPNIVVIGPPGAGKTYFAKKLGGVLKMETVIHLDDYFWKPGWIKTTDEERKSVVSKLTAKNGWIIEGNFLDAVDSLFSQADIVIWLNLNIFICLYRVFKRHYSSPQNWRDKLTPRIIFSIFQYKLFDMYHLREELRKKDPLHVITLDTPKKVDAYLSGINSGSPLF